jgi:glutamine amidotransferase
MIHIVDYGVGNIQAFMTMFKRIGIGAIRATSEKDLLDAKKIILPGVGAFDHAMERLNNSGMRPALDKMVLQEKIPVIGVCVGMQMLAASSEEGVLEGLNWVPGRVKAFASNAASSHLPMPHMGWNDLEIKSSSPIFTNHLNKKPLFYFLHSYYFDADNKAHVAATANYGFEFDAVVNKDHIYGIQCHPEKSHSWGAQLLKNFSEL